MSVSSQSRQLVLEATVAFRLREYERAVKLLTSLDSLLSGGNDVVKHNLVVAQWYAAQQIYSTSFAQWLDIHESIPKGKPCTNAAFIAQFNQSVYYFYANQPQKALEALQSLCFTGRKAESRLETSSVLLALDLFLGTRNIQQAVEYFQKLNLSELDAVAAPSDAKSFYDIIYHLYEARIQLASGRKWDAVNSLLQLSIPDEQESNGRVLGVAHWHLRSQLAMACYQTDTAYDLVAWHTDTADSKAVDQNARGCMYFEQSKWGLASFAFSQAAQLLKESEKDHSDVEDKQLLAVNHSQPIRHGCCSLEEATLINQCLIQLFTGNTTASVYQIETQINRRLNRHQPVSSIYWLMLGEGIIYLHVDNKDTSQRQPDRQISNRQQNIIHWLEDEFTIVVSDETSYSLEYAAGCFRQYLVTLIHEVNRVLESNETNYLISYLDVIPMGYRLAYAYGLLAWSWCELQRQDYVMAKLLLRQFIDIDTEWLTGDDKEEEEAKTAAKRIKFLSDIYIAVLFIRNERYNDALTLLNDPIMFNASSMLSSLSTTVPLPRLHAYEADLLTDRSSTTELRGKRQQLAVMAIALYQLHHRDQRLDYYRKMMNTVIASYIDIDQKRITLDARPSGIQAIDERLFAMINTISYE